MGSSSEVLAAAANAETGEAKYFDKGDMKQVDRKGIKSAEQIKDFKI